MTPFSTKRGFARAVLLASVLCTGAAQAEQRVLRVCADPNNLPFSNDRSEGVENRIAELVAAELGAQLRYFWWAQRRGFVRNTVKAGNCDLVMGVPAGYELLATTRPYYRSSYVYVYRRDRGLDLHSMRDPRLQDLRIGVHLIGDDGANTPPAHALGQQGLVDNVVGYMIYGDYREPNPPARLIEAVAAGAVDVAAVWGPIGGYFARRSDVPLDVVPISGTDGFDPRRFEFSIAAGVGRDNPDLLAEIDEVFARQQEPIRALLQEFGIPLIETDQQTQER